MIHPHYEDEEETRHKRDVGCPLASQFGEQAMRSDGGVIRQMPGKQFIRVLL